MELAKAYLCAYVGTRTNHPPSIACALDPSRTASVEYDRIVAAGRGRCRSLPNRGWWWKTASACVSNPAHTNNTLRNTKYSNRTQPHSLGLIFVSCRRSCRGLALAQIAAPSPSPPKLGAKGLSPHGLQKRPCTREPRMPDESPGTGQHHQIDDGICRHFVLSAEPDRARRRYVSLSVRKRGAHRGRECSSRWARRSVSRTCCPA